MANIEKYISSLETKLEYAEFHRDQALRFLESRNHIAAGAEFTAMMATLHTCLDILAQCINTNVDEKQLEKNVHFTESLIKKIPDPILRKKVSDLKESIKYLNAFTNVNKHWNLIRIIPLYSLAIMGVAYNYKTIVDEFSYNGNDYPESEILAVINREYAPFVVQIREIIQALPEEWLN